MSHLGRHLGLLPASSDSRLQVMLSDAQVGRLSRSQNSPKDRKGRWPFLWGLSAYLKEDPDLFPKEGSRYVAAGFSVEGKGAGGVTV